MNIIDSLVKNIPNSDLVAFLKILPPGASAIHKLGLRKLPHNFYAYGEWNILNSMEMLEDLILTAIENTKYNRQQKYGNVENDQAIVSAIGNDQEEARQEKSIRVGIILSWIMNNDQEGDIVEYLWENDVCMEGSDGEYDD